MYLYQLAHGQLIIAKGKPGLLEQPLEIGFKQDGQLVMSPFAPFAEADAILTLNMDMVVYRTRPDPKLVEDYERALSPIVTADKKIITGE